MSGFDSLTTSRRERPQRIPVNTVPTDHLLDRLTEAYWCVAESERDVARQRNIVAALECKNRDCSAARQQLARYEESLAAHIGERAQLLAELFHNAS
jgi:hypothetical protein